MKNMKKMGFLFCAVAALFSFQAACADTVAVEKKLKELYPNTQFASVKTTPIEGLYEVLMGQNLAYVHENGRYFVFGAMYDMQEQRDLTAQSRAKIEQVTYQDLPFKQAIKIIKGNGGQGKREFALFTDPDCPFCRRLEETLAGMNDYTVYVFLYPIRSLHPDAVAKAEHIWCSKKPIQAWHDYMLLGKDPKAQNCANPIADNIELAEKLNVRGTPTMLHRDGRRTSGALPRAELERWLNGESHE